MVEGRVVLLDIATSAIFFKSASGFYKLELVVGQLKVALLNAKDCIDAKLLEANNIEASLRALRALGALGAFDRET